MEKLYIVSVFTMERKTDKDIENECKINSIRYNREFTLDRWNELNKYPDSQYKFSVDEVAYFTNKEEVEIFLKNNTCDINEYTYDYGIIKEIPMNCAYPESYLDCVNLYVYSFNFNKREYEEFKGTNELLEIIKSYFTSYKTLK